MFADSVVAGERDSIQHCDTQCRLPYRKCLMATDSCIPFVLERHRSPQTRDKRGLQELTANKADDEARYSAAGGLAYTMYTSLMETRFSVMQVMSGKS